MRAYLADSDTFGVVRLGPAEIQALDRFREGLSFLGDRARGAVRFGSRGRGERHEDSDLDVLVLLQELTSEDEMRVIDAAFDVELPSGIAISPLVRERRGVGHRVGHLLRDSTRRSAPLTEVPSGVKPSGAAGRTAH